MQEVLRKLRAKLMRLARTAEDFRNMASPDWAPRIGAYINAAHWMSHSLQEAAGPLLLLESGRCQSFRNARRSAHTAKGCHLGIKGTWERLF